MSIVKEYEHDKTKIRIHDDFIGTEENNKAKEMIISIVVNNIKKINS